MNQLDFSPPNLQFLNHTSQMVFTVLPYSKSYKTYVRLNLRHAL